MTAPLEGIKVVEIASFVAVPAAGALLADLGAEVVLVTAGVLRLHQEIDGSSQSTEVGAGQYAINAPGVWHTADVIGDEATAVFITAGHGTEHRPR